MSAASGQIGVVVSLTPLFNSQEFQHPSHRRVMIA